MIWHRPGLRLLAGLVCFIALSPVRAAEGDYTRPQAREGHGVYANHCAKCHGSDLQGQAGPALAGKKFKSSLEFSGMSAKQLLSFIATHMPYNKPGTLSQKQYEDVLAYILQQNGYPSGKQRLTTASVGHVKLLPYPAKQSSGAGDSRRHVAH